MILSFHPCFEANQNIICAGREPGPDELAAIKAADTVILPQGCKQSLYEMARTHCTHVFPNYDVRFKYPGKIGQIHLFEKLNVPHPKTKTYLTVDDFFHCYGISKERETLAYASIGFPFVFKFDWGGEGDNVFLIDTSEQFDNIIKKALSYEKTGQKGFLIQEFIPSQNRSLRVVLIGTKIISYWRIQKDRKNFCANLAKGAITDSNSDPALQSAAIVAVKDFCRKTGINLAGFDFLFSSESEVKTPLFLEINYFFGRHGLGGSEKFYQLLIGEINKWILSIGRN